MVGYNLVNLSNCSKVQIIWQGTSVHTQAVVHRLSLAQLVSRNHCEVYCKGRSKGGFMEFMGAAMFQGGNTILAPPNFSVQLHATPVQHWLHVQMQGNLVAAQSGTCLCTVLIKHESIR